MKLRNQEDNPILIMISEKSFSIFRGIMFFFVYEVEYLKNSDILFNGFDGLHRDQLEFKKCVFPVLRHCNFL